MDLLQISPYRMATIRPGSYVRALKGLKGKDGPDTIKIRAGELGCIVGWSLSTQPAISSDLHCEDDAPTAASSKEIRADELAAAGGHVLLRFGNRDEEYHITVAADDITSKLKLYSPGATPTQPIFGTQDIVMSFRSFLNHLFSVVTVHALLLHYVLHTLAFLRNLHRSFLRKSSHRARVCVSFWLSFLLPFTPFYFVGVGLLATVQMDTKERVSFDGDGEDTGEGDEKDSSCADHDHHEHDSDVGVDVALLKADTPGSGPALSAFKSGRTYSFG